MKDNGQDRGRGANGKLPPASEDFRVGNRAAGGNLRSCSSAATGKDAFARVRKRAKQ
jgi:hypothetical protein